MFKMFVSKIKNDRNYGLGVIRCCIVLNEVSGVLCLFVVLMYSGWWCLSEALFFCSAPQFTSFCPYLPTMQQKAVYMVMEAAGSERVSDYVEICSGWRRVSTGFYLSVDFPSVSWQEITEGSLEKFNLVTFTGTHAWHFLLRILNHSVLTTCVSLTAIFREALCGYGEDKYCSHEITLFFLSFFLIHKDQFSGKKQANYSRLSTSLIKHVPTRAQSLCLTPSP